MTDSKFYFSITSLLRKKQVILALTMLIYLMLLTAVSGLSFKTSQMILELPLVLYVYLTFFFVLKKSQHKALIAIIPIVVLYSLHDLLYLMFGEVPTLSDINELPELIDVTPHMYIIISIALISLPCIIVFKSIKSARVPILALGLLPIIAFYFFIQKQPDATVDMIEAAVPQMSLVKQYKNVEKNGRLVMLFYHEAQRVVAYNQSARFRDREKYNAEVSKKVEQLKPTLNHQNVHLIMLESLLDPTLFSNVKFSQPPAHPDFIEFFGDALGLSISPTFGGATVLAEFEVLCGVPAYRKISSIEFNVFTGAKTHCLPVFLERLGYKTYASNAYKPNFFNTTKAYKSIGFETIYFPKEYKHSQSTYISVGDVGAEKYMFDGDLFDQNLDYITKLLNISEKPIFNYVLGVYGHFNYYLDSEKRPTIIEAEYDYPDDKLKRVANQYYYRTEALVKYVKRLIAVDPDSLIIIISDHLPALLSGRRQYEALAYLDNITENIDYNRVMIVEAGMPVKYNTIHHYDIPSLILNFLTQQHYCMSYPCNLVEEQKKKEEYIDDYMSIVAHAID